MVMRGPADIGCAHCTQLGAAFPCSLCTRLVCNACAPNPQTCSEPTVLKVRLGRTARVLEVDPNGRLAIVSHAVRGLRLLDLRAGRWLTQLAFAPAADPSYLRLTDDGSLVCFERVTAGATPISTGVSAFDPTSGAQRWFVSMTTAPRHVLGVAKRGNYVWFTTGGKGVVGSGVCVVRSREDVTEYDPMPGLEIIAAAVDPERELLATAALGQIGSSSWTGRLSVNRMVGDRLERVATTTTEPRPDVLWLDIANDLVCMIARNPSQCVLEVLDIAPGLPQRYRRALSLGDVRAVALSRDGRFLALGVDRVLHVHDLAAQTVVTLDRVHTDDINYVRFTASGELISADNDNRVVVWPPNHRGYAHPVTEIEVQ